MADINDSNISLVLLEITNTGDRQQARFYQGQPYAMPVLPSVNIVGAIHITSNYLVVTMN